MQQLHVTGEETRKHSLENRVHPSPPTISTQPGIVGSATAEDIIGLEEPERQRQEAQEKQEEEELLPSSYDRLCTSLERLREALPRRKPQYGSTMQDMSDMTALITSRMYAPKVHSGIEGEVRQEIRAAKGLLLNRFVSIYVCHIY